MKQIEKAVRYSRPAAFLFTDREIEARRRARGTEDGATLQVVGHCCPVFRNDAVALWIDREQHMIQWMDDEDLRIDRYDVRAIVEDQGTFLKRRDRSRAHDDGASDASAIELRYERYRDAGEVEHLRTRFERAASPGACLRRPI